MTTRTPTRVTRTLVQRAVTSAVIYALTWQPLLLTPAQANFSAPLIQLFDQPFLVGERIPPFVMMAITRDQQLFKKAYDDFSDLDQDGVADTTYRHDIDYYGHFDSYKCYVYASGNRRFEPASITNSKYCSGQWSGNFLNWATMTRMDALRKVLFGGLRSPDRSNGDGSGIADGDTATSTVLERAYLPTDAHSFAKYYDGADTAQLTPFADGRVALPGTPIVGSNKVTERSIDTANKRVSMTSTSSFPSNEWVQLTASNGSFVRGRVVSRDSTWIEVGNITAINTYTVPGTSSVNAAANGWTVSNPRTGGITICNTTDGDTSGTQSSSETNTNLPRMKVARGNFSLWNAGERWQCTWSESRNASNGNDPASSGLMAFSSSPSRASYGLDVGGSSSTAGKGDYFVRTQVCVDNLIGKERCKVYPSGNYKPTGLLQTFGETDRIRFGLMTGSYKRNLSGGVLRKNISPLNDEIRYTTDGTFISLGNSGVGGSPAPGNPSTQFSGGSIIRTLSLLRMVGYNYNDGAYISGINGRAADNCPYQRALDTNGECKSWGNPMSEVFYEGLRYMAGQTAPTTAFNADDTTVISGLATAQWPSDSTALLSSRNYCAPLNMLVVNSSVSTNEHDNQIGSLSFMDGSPGSVVDLTNTVGNLLGLSGLYFYGRNTSTASTSPGYQICSGKTLSGLGEIYGICPEGPTVNGSYHIAGLAYHAHVNRVRKDIELPASAARLKRQALHVDTYGVSIAGGTPRIPVKFAGEKSPRVVIQPAYRLTNGTYGGGGSLVDARIIRQVEEADRSYGHVMVSWEDSEAGGDYDMDVWGLISYEMIKSTNEIKITTDAIYDATANPQGFGYVISGTDRDGLHFHSGILNFSYTDPTPGMSVTGSTKLNASGGCQGCYASDPPTTATYTLTTTPPAKSLEDPLYYAALMGGFHDTNGNKRPDGASIAGDGTTVPSEYDRRNNLDGSDVPDGQPDNYFRVDNPLGLEIGLERTFQLISEQSSLAALSSSSTRIVSNSSVFQAKFNSGDWSGSLESLPIRTGGVIGTAAWYAATTPSLNATTATGESRVILTRRSDTRSVVPFRFDSLATEQKDQLNRLPSGVVDNQGGQRVAYLRGDRSNEGSGVSQFRRRSTTVLGDIVNSSPVYVGKPAGGIGSASYLTFISANANRTPMLYVGANDGMLHGFNAETGREVFAYVPTSVYPALNSLPTQDYQHRYYVDGQLTTQDVEIGTTWRTYLVGALGRGGQGIFGLDVTNPASVNEATGGNVAKWEFTDADDARLGYVYSQPILRKANDGNWYAIVSSGYNAGYADGRSTTDGRAAIFMLKLSGPTGANGRWVAGTDYFRIDLPEGTVKTPNGVGGVSSFDIDGDGKTDLLYAGDLLGNVWRIDVRGAIANDWTGSGRRNVLFRAVGPDGRAQSITAAPGLTVGPGYQGAMVIVGTGRLLEPADLKPLASGSFPVNSIYGLWDKITVTDTVLKTNLMKQVELIREGNGAYANGDSSLAGVDFSLMSAYVPNYTSTARTNAEFGASKPNATGPTASTPPQRGWYLDVPGGGQSGERSLYRPEIVGNFAIIVNAIPSAIACEGGGSEAQYAIESLTGGRSNYGGFDRDQSGSIQAKTGTLLGDQSAFGLGGGTGGGSQPSYYFASRREATGGFGQLSVLTDVGSVDGGNSACAGSGLAPIGTQSFSSGLIGTQRLPGGCIGRIQWREIINH